MKLVPEFVILDFETTDGDFENLDIFEIGAIKMRGLDIVDEFHALIKPSRPISTTSIRITGVTNEMVKDQPSLSEILPSFIDFIGSSPLVAHNSEFESKVTSKVIAPLIEPRNFEFHDTFDVLGLIYPELPSLSEDYFRKYLNIEQKAPHRALNDCRDLVKILTKTSQALSGDRSKMAQVIRNVLIKNISEWWWQWVIPTSEKFVPISSLHDGEEMLGDLEEQVREDSERIVEWESEEAIPDVGQIFAAHAQEQIGGEIGITFQTRPQQIQMSEMIQKALANGERISVEAPTGTGKSIAYLLPGILSAEATQVPIVISTKTKALQNQLLEKDIQIVKKFVSDREIRAVTVKGQENYICLRKLYKNLDELLEIEKNLATEQEYWAFTYLINLALLDKTAEVSGVSWFFKRKNPFLVDLLTRITAHHNTTIGYGCPYYNVCRYHNAGRAAHNADVIIANHSLVFNWPHHFPKIRNVIFDEAHHLEEQATQATSRSLNEREFKDGLHDFFHVTRGKVAGTLNVIAKFLQGFDQGSNGGASVMEKLESMAGRIQERFKAFTAIAPTAFSHVRSWSLFRESVNFSDPVVSKELKDAAGDLAETLGTLSEELKKGLEKAQSRFNARNADVKKMSQEFEKFLSYREVFLGLLDDSDRNIVRLLNFHPDHGWEISIDIVDVSTALEWSTFRSVVLTSATLGVQGNKSFIPLRLGLGLSHPPVVLPSPYDLKNQARLYFPIDLAKPGTTEHLLQLISFTEQVARSIGGRTLLLICANSRVKEAAAELRLRLEPHGIEVIDKQNPNAVEIFKATDHAVLVGSEQHGEGVDIPGQGLSCVIIEKINESMTMKPLAKIRESRINFGLINYSIPLRVMWLKQRVGRLIRSTTDRGWIIVFDSRIYDWKPYSQDIVLDALAPMSVRDYTCEQILEDISKTKEEILNSGQPK